MSRDPTFDELWDTAPRATAVFDPARVADLPAAAQRYLLHALAPGAPLASAVRLRMHGTIRLKEWYPFEAEQVIRWDRGFVWRATVKMHGLPIRGSDRLVDGEGAMRWKLLGLLPIVTASGPEIARSAAGRVNAEAIWLPGVLLSDEVRWTEHGASHAEATLRAHGEESHLDLELDAHGSIRTLQLPRWGDPAGGGSFHYEMFGGVMEAERTFAGVTVPTQFRLGWFWGTDRFESEGEFFRATIDHLEHR